MATVSDYARVEVASSDTTLTFTLSFKNGCRLMGEYGNPGQIHIRQASGCTSSNAPPIPTAPVAGSQSEFLPLPPKLCEPGITFYLTPSTGTNYLLVYPA
jgi:hypothetical protein